MFKQAALTRYPGAQPFTDDKVSRELFHGREKESTALTHQILANRLVVLFARSGLGKTSLLNAGVADKLRIESCLPLTIRVNDTDQGPIASVYRAIEEECVRRSVEYIPGKKTSLWHFFKSAQFWSQDILLTPVLIFDQFEELFTLNLKQQRNVFLDQFSHLVRGVRPKEPNAQSAQKSDLGAIFNDAAPAVKIIISLREDFLAELEEISDRIPEILDQRFRLLPLRRDAAAEALIVPAGIDDPLLITKPFKMDPQASGAILDFLQTRAIVPSPQFSGTIEPFQLQLICQHVEEIVQNRQRHGVQGTVTIGVTDVGGEPRLRKILQSFYGMQVNAVPYFFQRIAVRKLCSEFLINPQGRRIRLEESEIERFTGVKPQTLQILVDRRLLRRDRTTDGNYYELSHDSLIIPILHSRRWWFLTHTIVWTVLLVGGMPLVMLFTFTTGELMFTLLVIFWFIMVGYRRGKEIWRRFRI